MVSKISTGYQNRKRKLEMLFLQIERHPENFLIFSSRNTKLQDRNATPVRANI